MSRVLIDLTGKQFDRLEVLQRAGTRRVYDTKGRVLRTEPSWLCRCDCGKETTVLGVNLREKRTRSCGCLRSEVHSEMMKARHRMEGRRNDHDTAAASEAGT